MLRGLPDMTYSSVSRFGVPIPPLSVPTHEFIGTYKRTVVMEPMSEPVPSPPADRGAPKTPPTVRGHPTPVRLTPVEEIDAEGRCYIETTYLTDEDD